MGGRVEGKVVFITGAARGQGRSHAVRFAEEGASIIAVDLCRDISTVPYSLATADDLATTVKEVQAIGADIYAAEVDVRDFDSLSRSLSEAVNQFGRLDFVCANAGIASISAADEMSEATWQDMIDVNLTGVWHTCKAAIPHIKAGGRGGAITLTSSGAGMKAFSGYGHYVSAKHGVIGLMRTLALELAPDSIRVNSVLPTNTDTAMIHNPATYRLFCPDKENPTREDFERASNEMMAALPVPWMDPVDISNAIIFLSSDEARYITGAALPVDGGFLIR